MSEPGNRENAGRGPDGRILPGHSGNPAGRPRLDPKVRAMLEAKTPDAAQRLIEALDAERPVVVGSGEHATLETVPDHDMRLKAAEAILNRLYGKPTVAVAGENGGAIPIAADATTLEMLRKLARP